MLGPLSAADREELEKLLAIDSQEETGDELPWLP